MDKIEERMKKLEITERDINSPFKDKYFD